MRRASRAARARTHLWTLLAGVALVAGAWWLRSPSVRYLTAAAIATVLSLGLAVRLPPHVRRRAVACAAVALLFTVLAALAQGDLDRIDNDWNAYRAQLLARGSRMLDAELRATADNLRATAERALDAPAELPAAFRHLDRLARRDLGRAVVLYRAGRPVAWAGRAFVPTDSLTAPLGVAYSPFYVTLYATASRGTDRAVAAAVVHADPPADQLTAAVSSRVAKRAGLEGFEFFNPQRSVPTEPELAQSPDIDTLPRAQPLAPEPEEARLLTLERVRFVGALTLGAALLLLLAASWRRERTVWWRLAPLGVALADLALVPLNAFSSLTMLFDPTVYFAELGGPFTASVGALGLASAIVLLGVLIVHRARVRVRSRWMALALMLAIVAGGPYLLRAVAAGVSPPSGGVTLQLWLAWEVALFLAAASLLVGATAAAASALGRTRRLPSWVGPWLAALAAFVGPIVVRAPGWWPAWYGLLWIGAIGALVLARPHRGFVFTAAAVAALGAATLTWNAGLRGSTALANRDAEGLEVLQPDLAAALDRLGDIIAGEEPPRNEAELVRVYMKSDLVGAGFPVELTSWSPDALPNAEVALDQLTIPTREVARTISEARRSSERVLREALGIPGTFLMLAVPHASGEITSVIVGPRTRLIPGDPYKSLLGLGPRETGEPPYAVALIDYDPRTGLAPGVTRWYRDGTEMHGDRVVQTARGPMRVHLEVEMRSQGILVQRGTLVVLLDLVVIAALWLLSVLPQGGFGRWLRARARHWARSYRARLGVALFAFFVLPAAAFALWSYQRLQSEDRQSRELLLRETLRNFAGGEQVEQLDTLGGRVDTPLLLYRAAELSRTSEPLFDVLAPTGRLLPPPVWLSLREGREVYTSAIERVGDAVALFGYRSVFAPRGDQLVVGAPAPGSDEALDTRRRDLGVLVAFGTVIGALAALWLSRIASRSLAQPIGSLREAALAIAAGEREPPLAGVPPEEFAPVFSAFRRMAADLGASRAALESAQRRTAAVLRNVASGVVAVAPDGSVSLANPRAEALLAHSLTPGTGMEGVNASIAERVRRFLAGTGDEEEFEIVLQGRQVQARLTRLTASDGGAVLTLDDVTELARAQRVLAWGEMARQVAHEIKNPLTPIRLGVQHLKRARADARADFDEILDQNVSRILAEIDRLDEIARGFSRYGTAPAERLPPEPVDVVAVVRDVVELERMGRDEVDWRLHGADRPLIGMARDDELREVLLNVLENARLADATRVDVRFVSRDGRVIVEVRDDGRGIPAHLLPRLFEPHFSTRTSGSGFGLAISRQLVESWGGEIAIASVEGEGTTVRIELQSSSERPDRQRSDQTT